MEAELYTVATCALHAETRYLEIRRLGRAGWLHAARSVGTRRRISDENRKEGLTLSQLAPGPMAAQLGIFPGFLHYRLLGATLTGIAFVIPSFLMVVAPGWACQHFGGLEWMQAVSYGAGAAVIGIIAISAKKLTGKVVRQDKLLWAICLVLAAVTAVTAITKSEMALLFVGSGVLVWFLRAPRKWSCEGSLHSVAFTELMASISAPACRVPE